jgi:hypothetical protein
MSTTETQLRDQIKFEQFCNNFYIDLIVNHICDNDEYSKIILDIINDKRKNIKDLKVLNTELRNLPGHVFTMVKNGEIDIN